MSEDCLFCQIVAGTAPSKKVLETDNFLVIENKYPAAPVHVLVLSKKHLEKPETISGKYPGFWDGMIKASWEAIRQLGLDKTGYKFVNNGAGYHHFDHEHLHVLGGTKGEPVGKT